MRNEISRNSDIYISKHRYLELKHFCLQYPEWEEMSRLASTQTLGEEVDPTGVYASILADCKTNMELVRRTAFGMHKVLGRFIFSHVAYGRTYDELRDIDYMPCGRVLFYEFVRRYFFMLSREKG